MKPLKTYITKHNFFVNVSSALTSSRQAQQQASRAPQPVSPCHSKSCRTLDSASNHILSVYTEHMCIITTENIRSYVHVHEHVRSSSSVCVITLCGGQCIETHDCLGAVHYRHSPQKVDWTLTQIPLHVQWWSHLSVPGNGTSRWAVSLSGALHLPPSTETSWHLEPAGSPAGDGISHLQAVRRLKGKIYTH